jgi:tetraacyldisaccharide 4'-kinase
MRELLFKILLAPFSLLYGLGILLRNGLYQWGLLRPASFNLPVIGVGNLTLGGAGKTPHVEYLIRLLSPFLQVATLSRGYKRTTKGFRMVHHTDTALTVGDEPLQYRLKYPQVKVAVSESRSIGIPTILSQHPDIQVILLDDSYQHLSVTPGINILLTEYSHPYSEDLLLPAGRLREWKSGADRADIIIVSKCPQALSPEDKSQMKTRLDLLPQQSLYFSKYIYGSLYHIINGSRHELQRFERVILITAIAQESYLLDYIERLVSEVHTMTFEDHHVYSPHEMSLLKQQYDHLGSAGTAIVTTEKDATRLILHRDFIKQHQLPIMILPAQVQFLDQDGIAFNNEMKDFLMNFKY